MSLLDRDPSPEDRDAERDAPRCGVWAGERGADLRKLTQDETEELIRFELYLAASRAERDEIVGACGGQPGMVFVDGRQLLACQRGGIDSDPLVRILARRAWGDRDRRWFDRRGVRAGELVTAVPRFYSLPDVALARAREGLGISLEDARPGELVTVRVDAGLIDEAVQRETLIMDEWGDAVPQPGVARQGVVDMQLRVSDRLRERPYAMPMPANDDVIRYFAELRRVTSLHRDPETAARELVRITPLGQARCAELVREYLALFAEPLLRVLELGHEDDD